MIATPATDAPMAKDAPPALRLLGPPVLRHPDGRTTPWTAERPFLLLGMLACRGDWVARDELADRLYPNRELAAARSNLRKVLHLARQVAGADAIEQNGDLLRWAPDSDLARFEAACSAHRHAEALALYGGPLLQGLDSGLTGDAVDWLHAERQRLHARWHEACLRRLEVLLRDAPNAAVELAQALLRDDPLDDTALQALARAQQALGRPEEALAALRRYEHELSGAIGLAPSAALRALDARLQGDAGAAAPAARAGARDTGLVGRRQELRQIDERLAEPGCRLLTLLGEPGVGKSTLARAVLSRQPGGALWVPLEDLPQADRVPERIAAVAGVALDSKSPPWAALAQALGDAPRLLVLDNAEHLPLAAPLDGLLAARPALRALATSRSPVGCAGEWRLPIAGLPLPDADETDADVLRANDAVRLFEERARPLAPGFDLAAEAADVVRLVHEVDGLPLAIELLAAWRRLMPVREILAELAESLDLLEPVQPSERSVRASFARAWQQLGGLEQRVLAAMAVLPGPLTRGQVRAVLQAPLPVMATLADRSLVRAEDGGRFALHPLIRRCAAPLATDVPALRERHARQLTQQFAAGPQTDTDTAAIDTAHLRAAWQWGVDAADPAVLKSLARPLRRRLHHRDSQAESAAMLAAARAALMRRCAKSGAAAPRHLLEALLAVRLAAATAALDRGELPATDEEAAEAAALAEPLQDTRASVTALRMRANVRWQRAAYQEALGFLDEADTRRRAAGFHEHDQALDGLRAIVLKGMGRYDAALALMQRSFDGVRREGRLRDHLYLPNNMGNLLRLLGRYQEALSMLNEALQLSRQPGDPGDEPFLLTNIGLVHETMGDAEAAALWADDAMRSAKEHGEPMIQAAAWLLRARVGAALGRPLPDGLSAVGAALAIARHTGAPVLMTQAVSTAGVVLARSGQRPLGLAMVRWAQRQTDFSRSEREDAERHLGHLRIDPSEEAAALRRLPPDASLDQVLAALPPPPKT